MRKLYLIAIFICGVPMLWAQYPDSEYFIDPQIVFGDESSMLLGEESIEKQQEYLTNASPLNINDSLVRAEMQSYGLLQSVELIELEKHIRKYGPLIHIYELALIPAISIEWVMGIAPYLSFISGDEKGQYRRPRLRLSSRGRLRKEAEDSLCFFRTSTRIGLALSPSVDASVLIGKGEGESLTAKGMSLRPELFSGFLRYRGNGLIRQLVMGDYAIQGGAGIRYGSAWSSWNPDYPLADAFNPYRIAGRTSGLEGVLRRGAAIELRKGMFRLDIALSRNLLDGYMTSANPDFEWKGNTSATHLRSVDFARRARSEVDRNSLRLGVEKEWIRTGMSLEAYRISSAYQNDSITNTTYDSKALGFDLQMNRNGNVLWAEASVLPEGWAGAFAFNGAASSWMSICIGGQHIQSSMPVPSSYSLLADAAPSRTLYAAFRISWGDGWAIRAGVRRTNKDAGFNTASMKQDAYLVFSRSGFNRIQQRLSLVHSLPIRNDGGLDLNDPLQKVRFSYRFSDQMSAFSTRGGMQISLSRIEKSYSQGLACYLSGRLRIQYRFLEHINTGLALHLADHADNRAYFWFPGSEGRTIMHQLYHNGWRIAMNASIRIAREFMVYPGLMYSMTRNAEGDLKRMSELGIRLVYSSR